MDTDIARAAENALRSCIATSFHPIEASVSCGVVTLRGDVEWDYQRRAAEGAVRDLPGVRGLMNAITVHQS